MKLQNYHISIVRGDSGTLTVRCKGPGGEARPFSEGGCVRMAVKTDARQREPLLQKTETGFPEGAAVFSFAPEDTRALPFGNYRYDVRLTDREGNVFTIVPAGDFTVLEAIADA